MFEVNLGNASTVEAQAELVRTKDNIWNTLLRADLEMFSRIIEDQGIDALMERGPVGETPLHLAFLYNSPNHNKLIEYIIAQDPTTIFAQYAGEEYRGENCLHIAIINQNIDLVRLVLSLPDSHQLLDHRATGSFFEHGKPCGYGETPLAFAISTGQAEIADLLIAAGADLFVLDSNGNNLLHMAVLHTFPDMYQWVVEKSKEIWEKTTNNSEFACSLIAQTNYSEMTPLALAASIGNMKMFEFIVDQNKIVQWSYGPITAVLYPLEFFDNNRSSPDEPRGALEFIVEHEQTELLMIPRVVLLLKRKWQSYSNIFRTRLYKVLVTLYFFTLAIITQPSPDHPEDYTSFFWWVRTLSEIGILVSAILKFIPEVYELKNSGIRGYFGGAGAQLLENLISSVYCLTVFIGVFLRLFQTIYYDLALALAVFLCWFYLLLFLLGHPSTGHFVIMLVKMLFGDLLKFLLIFLVFLLSFTYAFYVLFDEVGLYALVARAMSLFELMLGGYDPEYVTIERFYWISSILVFVYALLASILLLNLLIAMMAETYSQVSEAALNQWHLEWARIIFSIEAELDEQSMENLKYWTTIDGKRYLMAQEVDDNHFKSKRDDGDSKMNILKAELAQARADISTLISHLPPNTNIPSLLSSSSSSPFSSSSF